MIACKLINHETVLIIKFKKENITKLCTETSDQTKVNQRQNMEVLLSIFLGQISNTERLVF